jgi:hypothetical protein
MIIVLLCVKVNECRTIINVGKLRFESLFDLHLKH